MRSTSPKHKTVFATNISEYYDKLNEIDSALVFFKALMQDSSFSNPYYDAVRYETLGTLLSKKGEANEGLSYQLKGIAISRELGEGNAQSYFNIAATYRKLGEFKKDEALLDTALAFVAKEKNWSLQKKIWRSKAENLAFQKKFEPAYAAMDSSAQYYQKEVDSSIIVRAKELEIQYGLLEKDNQIKSLALANQTGKETQERQQKTIFRILFGAIILGFLLVWIWRRKHYKRLIREESLRLQLLRGQIESHFLYNSVDVLKGIIQKGDKEKAIEFVQQLARLYRLSLENARAPFVLLNKELDALTSYLELQQTLASNGFNYHIDVEDIPDGIMIPPMLLQPFAENAIIHGFEGQQEKGQINILIKRDQRALYCIIDDNGKGFQGIESNHDHKRPLSTVINQERLAILSRQTKTVAKLTIIDKKTTVGEPGVRIELVLPYKWRTEKSSKKNVDLNQGVSW